MLTTTGVVPLAVVTNDHKLSSLTNTDALSSSSVGMEVHTGHVGLKSSRTVVLPEALGRDPFPCLFQVLEVTHSPWLMAPSSVFNLQSQQCQAESFSSGLSLVPPLLHPPSS